MQIFTSLKDINIDDRTSVALGNFDGIHIGHLEILRTAIDQAHELGLKSLCYTFSNHPFNYIMGRSENDPEGIKLICTEAQKIEMLEALGFDILVNVPFDEQTMSMRAQSFLDDILFGRLNAAAVCVGFNYSFGARAEGKPELLLEEGAKRAASVTVVDPVKLEGELVSSTMIRKLIADGQIDRANRCLGRDYCFAGKVEHGRRIGRTLGFPTVNLPAPINRALPPNGVYFGRIELEGEVYKCISNIGVRPTVSENDSSQPVADAGIRPIDQTVAKNIETHIFDYSGECYGADVKVYFEYFARPEMKFASREALHEQIQRDCDKAREYFDR